MEKFELTALAALVDGDERRAVDALGKMDERGLGELQAAANRLSTLAGIARRDALGRARRVLLEGAEDSLATRLPGEERAAPEEGRGRAAAGAPPAGADDSGIDGQL